MGLFDLINQFLDDELGLGEDEQNQDAFFGEPSPNIPQNHFDNHNESDDVFDIAPNKQVKGVYQVKEKQKEPTHSHPSSKNAVVEKKEKYVGSLGEVNQEGCKTHNDERYVEKKVTSQIKSPNKLKEYLIMSEVLGAPRCKRRK